MRETSPARVWRTRGGGALLCDSVALRCVRHLLAARGEMVLTVGMLHVDPEGGALAPHGTAPAPESAGGPQCGGIDRGLGHQAAAA